MNIQFLSAKKETFTIKNNSTFKVVLSKKSDRTFTTDNGEVLPVYYIGAVPVSDATLKANCKASGIYPMFTIYGETLADKSEFSVTYSEKRERFVINNGFSADLDASLFE